MHIAPDRITIFQTSDQSKYLKMLDATSATTRLYCARHGYEFHSFIGVWRGFHNWHATYNRIPYLMNQLEMGNRGWILYMDADAYVNNIDFDLREYLKDKTNYAIIGAGGGGKDVYWDINIGVFLINLGHEFARLIIKKWHEFFMSYSDEQLQKALTWEKDIPSDQGMMHMTLDKFPEHAADVLRAETSFINSPHASFVRQILRAGWTNFDEREKKVIALANEIADRFRL